MTSFLPRKIFFRLFSTNVIIIVSIIISFLWLLNISFTSFYYSQKKEDLKVRAVLASNILKVNSYPENLDKLDSLCQLLKEQTNTRYTIIDMQFDRGRVLADSHENPSSMDNHFLRNEVQDAVLNEIGYSNRYSETVKKEMLYLAISDTVNGYPLIIRTSVPIESLQNNISDITIQIFAATIIIIIVSLIISSFLSRKMANPLEEMAISAKMFAKGEFKNNINPNSSIFEIDSLSNSLNLMAKQLDERIKMITIQKNETEAILSSMSEGLIATNQLNKIIKINDCARDFFNLKGRVVGVDIRTVITDNNFIKFYNHLDNQNNTKKIEVSIDDLYNRAILCSGTKLKDEEGNFIGNVIALNDITKIKSLEKVRQEFVSNVSHELKTPLTALKGYVETLRDVDNDKDRDYFINILDKHTLRMNSIINDLLELSKLEESNQKSINISEVNVNDLIQDSCAECEYAAKKKGIDFSVICSVKITSNFNKRLIQEALVNLIHNAIQYSDKKTKVKIEGYVKRKELYLSVQDSGIGIEVNEIENIFKRFYCVDKSHSKETGGTGLGLSIVRHIVNLHNGKIEVQSKIGKGSEFILIIPKGKNV